MSKSIYLDNNATTKTDPEVVEAMLPFFTEVFGNASSTHEAGVKANQEVREARAKIARLIGSDPHEIIYTSGATEAINLALKGLVEASEERKHIITLQTEHSAVLDTCKYLESKGCRVDYLPVQPDGLVSLDILKAAITEETLLVSIMYVNNETGVIQPIKEIAGLAHEKGAFFFSDATQAVGKIPVNVNELGIDLLCFTAHKFYGAKGIGGLYIRGKGENKPKPVSLLHGGGHEKGLRSGTLNVPGIIGMGKAAELAWTRMETESIKIKALRNYLESELLKIEDSFINGNISQRLYNVTNICFKGADSDAMITSLKNISFSKGSACSNNINEKKNLPSHVLKAMGLSDDDAFSALRLSVGRFNTQKELEETIKSIKSAVQELRSMI